jgi:hypothetical protein
VFWPLAISFGSQRGSGVSNTFGYKKKEKKKEKKKKEDRVEAKFGNSLFQLAFASPFMIYF